ncbi:peptide ABC transporter substrate-binding protein [uncultured Streptococcus sp.]|uniref:peptide ABC transporter substrate-binding protein n=1 Tax=uncultured Streptococcus sp. TaxID=83427 RepID=UPI0025F905EB|nr:peptide ABC transporter substrate-binding protein [uncultured Streptococcus sp.]
MKKSKWLALVGVALLSVGALAACSSKSNTSGTTYGYIYSSDPETLDYITSNTGPTTTAVTNGVDGLMEADKYGNLVPSVAEDWSVSQDGLTYTYKIRKGVKWYTSDGEEYADVTAKDFVTGLKHAADAKAGALYLVQDSIAGLSDYLSGANKDFSNVGVKAIDDYTLQYTLKKPEPYWNSKTTYSLLFPVNGDFLKNKGKDFGKSTDPTSILYNGPFLLKSLTAKSSIELTKNENYWDKKNVHFDAIKLTYDEGSDPESLERSFTDGAYSIARVFPMSSNYASVEKKYKDNIFYTAAGASTSAMSVNIDRQSYKYTAKKTDAEKTSTKKALLNKDFRQSINFAIDRTVYQSQVNGKDGAAKAIRNLFVPSDFVSAGNKTFGDLVTEKMSSYGNEWSGVNFADSQDGLYNAEKAKTEFSKAKEALQGEGVQFPIHLDLPVDQTSKLNVSQAQSLKQTIEKSLGSDNVVIDINQLSSDDMQNVTLNAPNAAAEDWDISNGVIWSPDYQDPSTYLNIFKTTSSENTKTFMGYDDPNNAAAAQVGLKDYDALLDSADSETTDLNVRYDRYAQAQAWLEDSSLVMPLTVGNGAAPVVSRLTPFTGSYTQVGDKSSGDYFKYVKPQEKVVTKKEFEQSREKWLKEKKVSNEKAQKDLEKHVK